MKLDLAKHFIEPEHSVNPKTQQPASYLRKPFIITKAVECAMLYMTALGVYKGYCNGAELDAQLLLPGRTDYRYRVQYQSYEVTQLLRLGENVIGAIVGDGWYRGCIGIGSKRNFYGTKIALSCVLDIRYTDGSQETLCTDPSWKATQNGPLRENNLKTIEAYDARMEISGWNEQGFSALDWHSVAPVAYGGQCIAQEGEKISEHECFSPKVLNTPDGGTVLDFGQNMAGRVHFTVTGRAGHTVTLTMGEVLEENGCFTQKNLSAEGSSLISGELGQKLVYTLRDGMQIYAPYFLICGFRYVKVENWPEPIRAENFRAFAVYSDVPETGWFSCSNPLINQLVHNVKWGLRSNFVDIPTDNPTRERTGWTGDISVFCETACWLTDPGKFLSKWLRDFLLEQDENGNLPCIVPTEGKPKRSWGCAGWSDAIANVPMTLHSFFDCRELLEEVYDATERFVSFNLRRARKKKWLGYFKWGKHRNYIIETGFHYGEWLEPGRPMFKDYIKALFAADTEVTTAWFYHTVCQLAQMAKLLGKDRDAVHYRELSARIRAAYRREFLRKGRVSSNRHCRYVRPVAMGLTEPDESERIVDELSRKCADNGYRVGTGFLTTWKLLQTLSDYGHIEDAYRILENTEQPGWLYSVTKGATTVWENWGGITADGVPVDSHNHYAPGAVVAWLFSRCAGIRALEPGFGNIEIRPLTGGTLSWARAEYHSCRGKIVSHWEKKEGKFLLHGEIPEGVEATIHMPNGEAYAVQGGAFQFEI